MDNQKIHVFKFYYRFLKPYLVKYIFSTIGLLASAIDMLIPMFIGKSIDIAVDTTKGLILPADAKTSIMQIFFWIIGTILVKVVIFFFSRYTVNVIARRVSFKIRNEIYSKLMVLSNDFFNSMKTGEIMNRAASDTRMIMRFLTFGTIMVPNSVFRLIVAFSIIFGASWQLALSILAIIPLITLVPIPIAKVIHRQFKSVQKSFDKISNRIQENFSGSRTIKSYAQNDPETKRFSGLMDGYVEVNKKLNRTRSFIRPLLSVVVWIPIIGIIWFGGYLFMQNILTIGQLSSSIVYIVMLIWPIMSLGHIIEAFQRAKVSTGRIEEILQTKPTIKTGENPYTPETVRGDIEIIDATLKYDDSSISVEGLSLKVPKGQIIGIVGPVGAGKSSFTKMLLRTWDVAEGSVKVDGVDVRDWDLSKLRSSIGYVPQDAFLFSSTIAENISFIKPEATREEIEEVAKKIQLHDEIMGFDEGYETVIGERGVTLSGGQRQRVAISRAVLANPPIMIFDDPLSAVDTHTESAIIESIAPTLEGKTAIIIAHRVSIMTLCDRIIVIRDGCITEDGTHEELIAKNGYYAELVEKQRLHGEIDNQTNRKGINNA
ncbi:MAG: ABC transporter ATP-binding protein [Caldisericia bacterium]